jgi:single-strand DNA-binding protein
MWGVNRATLIGNVGQVDPRHTGEGKLIVNIRLATSRSYKDNAGEKQEKTEWHSVVVFGKLAEVADAHITVGSALYVEGEIRYRTYTGNDGVERYVTEIAADELRLLGPKREGEPRQSSRDNSARQTPRENASQRQGNAPQRQASGTRGQGNSQGGFNRMSGGQSPGRQAQPAGHDDDPLDSDIPF